MLTYIYLIFLAFKEEPSDGCSYEVFDYFTKEPIKNATATYRANEDILKLSNVNTDLTEMPYYLKFNGTEIPSSEFYLLTNLTHIENHQNETFCGFSQIKCKTILLQTPHRFWSYYVLKGKSLKNIKINNDWYIANKPQESAKIKQNLTILTGYFE